MTGDRLFAAYLEGREVRWHALYEREIAKAGNDRQARLLALFETLRVCTDDPGLTDCTFAGIPTETAGPFSRRIILRHEITLRSRMAGLAAEAGVPDPDVLAENLLTLFRTAALLHRTGARPAVVAEAVSTASRLVGTALPARGTLHPVPA
ncbi:hypothetical protein [Amycolatopsis sp. YIM 10]|uniref:hypothetical protein n=1 Tax=Amycolatopsis sp. YIM 10 TaxID=2653857 RepID=UPI00128FD301|nr:hypothetical protein [Amycolatopsis sp. YIM 10]QFU91876.1 hypothetical protein YIM_33575 [Amycolatopsis sp. YIM 10]